MEGTRDNGIRIGVVMDLDDPDRLGRVKVRYPLLEDQESDWARLATPMAGKERGLFLRPEIDDEVLVAFENGDPRRPYILGGLWSHEDPPPPDDGAPTENNWRFLRSRSGHVVKLDDTRGSEKIEIIDKDESRRLVIDTAGRKIQILCDAGDIEVKAPAGSVAVEARTISIKATGNLSIEAGGVLTIQGATVNIN